MVNKTFGQVLSRQSKFPSAESPHFDYRTRSGLQARDLWSAFLVNLFNLTVFIVLCTIYYAWTASRTLRFLLSASRSERMANQNLGHFAYRIRSGLEARDLWSASLVYLLNFTVLVVFVTIYYAWAAWLTLETNYWVLLTFSVLVLLAIEYILITFTIEQIERGRTCFLVKLTSWEWAGLKNRWTPHIRVAAAFILSLGFGVLAVRIVNSEKQNIITLNPDGTAMITVRVDESIIESRNQRVLVIIRSASDEMLYCVPGRIEGSNWIVSIKDKNFSDSSKAWKIAFYLRPLTPDSASDHSLAISPEVTCSAKRDDLRLTDISYTH